MKRTTSLFLAASLTFSAVVPNVWALDFDDPMLGTYAKTWIQRNPNATNLGFEKGPFGKTLTTFTKQLNSYAIGKDPAELRKFYRGLEGKLGAMSKKLAAKCGSDTGKIAADFTRFFDTKKSGACSNAVLVSLLGEIVARQQSELDEIPEIVENFEGKLGYLSMSFPTGAKASLKEVADHQVAFGFCPEWGKGQCYEMARLRFVTSSKLGNPQERAAETRGKSYDCQISRPFGAGSRLGFGEKIGELETMTFDPHIKQPGSDGPKSSVVPIAIERQPLDISGNLSKEEALKRGNAVSIGKKVYSFGHMNPYDKDNQAAWKKFRSSGIEFFDENYGAYTEAGVVFELVRFNDFSSMTGLSIDDSEYGKMNFGILHCRINTPYVGEW